jgi:Flp pilus assembly pilin Flp
MPVKPISSSCYAERGVTVAEYAVLLGLVLVLSIGGLKLLGGSISSLLGNASQKSAEQGTIKLLGPTAQSAFASGPTLGLKGSGYYAVKINPATGQPELTLIDGASATSSNVSSIDGSRMNTLGTVMLAKSLEELAAQETNPKLSDYYRQMAKASYYLAGAEGELDQIPGLEFNVEGSKDATYTKGDALADIVRYSSQLQGLMNNPPAELSSSDFNKAMPLALNAYNIAHQYQNAFNQFIEKDGKVKQNFVVPQLCVEGSGVCNTGNGIPGSSLQYASQAISGVSDASNMIKQPYEHFVSYDELRATADGVLAANKVDSLPVVSTIQDAQGLYAMPNTDTTNSTAGKPTPSSASASL